MRGFYDFNLDDPAERALRMQLFPELSRFHIALREELTEEEYEKHVESEKAALREFYNYRNQVAVYQPLLRT